MNVLISLYGKRLLRQKFIYFFLFAFCFAAYAYAFLITTPEMYSMLNIDAASISGARFPEFMVRFYSGNVGALFMSFITSIYINEEFQSDMISQPLLHGKTRIDIINAKIVTLCVTSLCMVLGVFIITYSISMIKWGTVVISMPVFGSVLIKYVLLAISLTVLEVGTILISLYAKNTVITVGTVFGCIMLSSLFNQNASQMAAVLSFDYYTYSWVFDYEFMPIPLTSACVGVALALFYGSMFYFLIYRKALKMDFSR